MKKEENEKKQITNDGILFCSGMIAGEGLVGIALALLAVFGVDKFIDISGILNLSDGVAKIAALAVSQAVYIPNPNSALSSNKEFAQAGP